MTVTGDTVSTLIGQHSLSLEILLVTLTYPLRIVQNEFWI